jgi:regulation of enolase protein 1 (concanavalin A-like superfamily)
MKNTFHIIRKDLHTLRWSLLLWVLACLNHLVLRLVQLARGDDAPFHGRLLSGNLETPFRWDYMLLVALSILLVPAVLLADPLTRPLAFWKSLPISRMRLLAAKLILIAALFVLLPLACETVYFLKAGLSSVLGESLDLWAMRFLPGIAILVLAGLLAPGLKSALPILAAGLWLVIAVFHYPVGKFPVIPDRTRSVVADPPSGARFGVAPESASFVMSYREEPYQLGKPKRRIEMLGANFSLDISGLPEDVKVDEISTDCRRLRIGDKTLDFPAGSGTRSSGNSELPLEEDRGQFNRNSGFEPEGPAAWTMQRSPMIDFSAADLPPDGATLEGEAVIRLVRRMTVASLPVEPDAAWQAGLHRLAILQASPLDSQNISFQAALKIVTSDPGRESNGLDLTHNDRHHLWLEHRTLPLRKHLIPLNRETWSPSITNREGSGTGRETRLTYDPTRSLGRFKWDFSLDPVEVMQERVAPLAATRFAEEQAQTRNWQIKAVTYEPAGSVRVPIKIRVPKPGRYLDPEREEAPGEPLSPPSSIAGKLAALPKAATLSRPEARLVFDQLERILGSLNEGQISNYESEVYKAISGFGHEHVEMLLERSFEALRPSRTEESQYQYPYGSDPAWRDPLERMGPFWSRVVRTACMMATPDDKELFLRYFDPRMDLLVAFELNGWQDDALATLCRLAATERLPKGWQDFLADHPSKETSAALFSQVRLRGITEGKAMHYADLGLLDRKATAEVLWEIAVLHKRRLNDLKLPFYAAIKEGVDIAPRDLLRIIRMDPAVWDSGAPESLNRSLLGLFQMMSLHSDCPGTIQDGSRWLEENASRLVYDPVARRYQLPGDSRLPVSLGDWGRLIDPWGYGQAETRGDDLILRTAGVSSQYGEVVEWRTAPRVLRKVSGDFTAEVTLQPTFGLAVSLSGKDSDIYQNAGILIVGDDHRWVRIEQNIGGRSATNLIRQHIARAGVSTISHHQTKDWNPQKPLTLRIRRHGNLIECAWRQADGDWVTGTALRCDAWPDEVQIGPFINSGVTRPLEIRFTGMTVTPGSPAFEKVEFPVLPHPAGEATADGSQIPGWGVVRNPIGSGIFKAEKNNLTLLVASKTSDYHVQKMLTSPRVLQEIEGDFTVETTIHPVPEPRWNAAELIITDERDFHFLIGLERNHDGQIYTHRHFVRAGRQIDLPKFTGPRPYGKPLRFRVRRKGGLFHVAVLQESGEWLEFVPLRIVDWPAQLKVGVCASNTSNETVTAVFEDFKLTGEGTKR